MREPGAASEAEVQAVTELAQTTAECQALLAKHVADYDEVLPHVFAADVRRLFVDLVNGGSQGKVESLLDGVERLAASDDPRVRNVIDVSFIEDLVLGANERDRRAIDAVRRLAGPATRAALAVAARS